MVPFVRVFAAFAVLSLLAILVSLLIVPSAAIPFDVTTNDTTPPRILSTDPRADAITNDKAPTIRVDYEDPPDSAGVASVTFLLDGLNLTSAGTWNETAFVVQVPFELRDGAHRANITIVDGVGLSTSQEWTFTIDSTPPALAVTSPDSGITRTAIATVAGTTEPSAAVTVNGSPATVDSNGSFEASVGLSEGENLITIVATDVAGNSAVVLRSVSLDTVPPALSVTAPANGAILASNVVRVAGTAEAGSRVAVNGVGAAVSASGDWSLDLAVADGVRTITTVAADRAGNVAQDVRTVTVDTVGPTVSVALAGAPGADGWYISVVTVVLAASDAGSGVTGITYRVNGGTWIPYAVPVALADGQFFLEFRATDGAGNVGPVGSVLVRVDTLAPGLTVTMPPEGTETERASVEVAGTVDDPTAVILVNGQVVRPDPGTGRWRTTVALLDGANTITIAATDPAGNRAAEVQRIVTFLSPISDIEEDVLRNAQAIGGFLGFLLWVLILLVLVLVGLQLALHAHLGRRIDALQGGAKEPPRKDRKGRD